MQILSTKFHLLGLTHYCIRRKAEQRNFLNTYVLLLSFCRRILIEIRQFVVIEKIFGFLVEPMYRALRRWRFTNQRRRRAGRVRCRGHRYSVLALQVSSLCRGGRWWQNRTNCVLKLQQTEIKQKII